ncbi:MAG: tetratricopeptide repeat protein [Elusimicrobia bacterium]|nr:tetratricopeptide repeat protein [Elusimicrobiota bacterium]
MEKQIERLVPNNVLRDTPQNSIWKQWFAIGLIVIVTATIYIPSLNAPFIFDDMFKIVKNPDIKILNNITTKLIYPYSDSKIFERNDPSRPLVYLTFTLNYYFGKLDTFGYHLVNLILHIFNAILLFFLTKIILSLVFPSHLRIYPFTHFPIFPFFVALFFAVHPISTSAVTYIFSRSDVLATFFYISSLVLFIDATKRNLPFSSRRSECGFQSLPDSRQSRFNFSYILSLICFVFALSSKPIAVTLPAIVLISDYILLNDFSIKKTVEKKYYHISFWVILIVYLLFRYFYFGAMGDVEAIVTWNIYDYLIIQPYIIFRYLKLLIIPVGLCIDHKINPLGILELKTIISFLFLTMIFWLTYRIYRKKTDSSKIILFCILWFFIILLPTSSFFPTTLPLEENRMYLSGIGFYFVLIFLYFSVFKSFNLPNFSIFLICSYIFILGIITYKRNQLYQQPILMWQDVISKYPDNSNAHYNLGNLFCDSKKYEEAEKEFREAIRINPYYYGAYNNLGSVLFVLKRFEEAEREYREATKLGFSYAESHYNLGNLLYNSKRYLEAEKEYKEAIRIDPNRSEAHNSLGVLLDDSKRFKEAEKEFRDAIRINPNCVDARTNLGILLYNSNKLEEAEKELREAIIINPDSEKAYFNLGLLLYYSKRYEEAEKEYKKVLGINPNYIDAYNNLGSLYCNLKKYSSALQEYEIAQRLSPNDMNIQNNIKLLKQMIKKE